jgi:glycine/D-amino acid oxidase-like deaminating enzyme
MGQFVEYLVVGAGIAGLSTAAHLVISGCNDLMVLDRERQIGFYSSSHNAAIGRQLTGTSEHTALAIEGRNSLADLGLLESSGGLLLATDPKGLDGFADEACSFGIATNRYQGAPFADCWAAETLEIPSDGVINLDGMLNWCAMAIREGGASILLDACVQDIQSSSEGFDVKTTKGAIKAKVLINAAGGWAQHIGSMASGLSIAFRPLRRHLIWSAKEYPQTRPWAWWADRPFYMRPESGGLLMSPLDETEIALPKPNCQPPTDPGVLEGMAETLREIAPGVAEFPINRLWCGLRTFSPDRKFVVGWDPINPRLFWTAGLGGHGMTTGLAVGRLAAKLLKESGTAGELTPSRFLG